MLSVVFGLPLVFGLGLLTSIAVLTSQAYGARKPADAGEVLRHGLLLSIAMGLLSTLAMFALHPFRHRLGQPADVAAAAGDYLLLFGVSMFPDGFQTWTIINTGDEPVIDFNGDGFIDGDTVTVDLGSDY